MLGDSADALGELPQPPSAIACVSGQCLVATNRTILARFDPDQGTASLVDVESGPAACLFVHDARIWACTDVDVPDHLWSTIDGESWTTALPRDAVVERTCPPGSPGAEACIFDDGIPPADTAAGDDASAVQLQEDAGCGCALGAHRRLSRTTGLPWTGLPWTGLPWTGLPWTGLPWTGLPWSRRRP